MTDGQERARRAAARQGEGARVAATLVGLAEAEALRRAIEAGFRPVLSGSHITADLDPNRIRIWIGEEGAVIRAVAG